MSDASKIDDGGSAFPFSHEQFLGLSRRDYFAAAAVPAVIANCASDRLTNGESREQMFARKALWVAEALIAASKSEAQA